MANQNDPVRKALRSFKRPYPPGAGKRKRPAAFVSPTYIPGRSSRPMSDPINPKTKVPEGLTVDPNVSRPTKIELNKHPDLKQYGHSKEFTSNSILTNPETTGSSLASEKVSTQTSTMAEPNPTSVGIATATETREPETTLGGTMMAVRGRFPSNEDHVPMDRPSGLSRYGNGVYTDDKSLSYPDQLNQNPIYPQDPASWDNFQHVRILSTVVTMRFFPQLSFSDDGKQYDVTQTKYFMNMFDEMSVNYRANKQANRDFDEHFTLNKVFTYFHDTIELYTELCNLMARQAYVVDKANPNNPANNLTLDQISIYLNTTEFWVLRNRMANALATCVIPEYFWNKYRFMSQLHRIGPMETATKHFFSTPEMDTLLRSAALSGSDSTKNATVRSNYITKMNAIVDRVEFGRTLSAPALKRYVTGTTKTNVFESATIALDKRSRNAISDKLQYCGLNFKSTGDLPPFPSHSVYNPKMCDIISNISAYALFTGGHGIHKAYPPILPNDATKKPTLEATTAYTSMRQPSEQDATTLETLASKFKGCSALHMDYAKELDNVDSFVGISATNFRTATSYIAEAQGVTSQSTTQFAMYPLITAYAQNAFAFVESNFTTKLFLSDSNTGIKYSSNSDDGNVPLYYATWGGIQQSMFTTKESMFKR
uniref:Uncharacterized protein n=2 Tax=viral metagenome TaxID=1070528 RepID=A0A2V0RAN2_9ZZZZ